MTGDVLAATVRLSVVGPDGRVDLTVPRWMSVASVAESYAHEVGLRVVPVLLDGSGATLDADLDLEQARLAHGDLLSVAGASTGTRGGTGSPTGSPTGSTTGSTTGSPTGSPVPPTGRGRTLPPTARAGILTAAAACALAAAALASASVQPPSAASGGHTQEACALLLLLCAVVSSVLPASTGRARRAVSAASPAFGAAAGFVAASSAAGPGRGLPGGLLLEIAVAGFGATVFAAVGRATLDDAHDELVEVWLAVGIGLAVAASALLLLGGSPSVLVAITFAAAVVTARVLPYAVVDVPDEALLDLDRLAVTAWSARERRRGGSRGRALVRAAGVGVVAGRAGRLVTAGTVVVALAVAVCGPLLVLGAERGHGDVVLAGHDLVGLGALVMVAFGGVALALVARVFRAREPRFALRCSSAWVLSVLAVELVQAADPAWRWAVFGAAAVLALVVTGVALSLGSGWRSVWWARAADLLEGLSMVCTIAAVVLASGLFSMIRAFTS